MQKAIIVRGSGVSELNDYLAQGYKVVSMCDMVSHVSVASGGYTYQTPIKESTPQCIVIIEK